MQKPELRKKLVTWQEEASAGFGSQPLLTVRLFIRLVDELKLTGYLAIVNRERLCLQLHVLHVLKTELGTDKGPVRTGVLFSSCTPTLTGKSICLGKKTKDHLSEMYLAEMAPLPLKTSSLCKPKPKLFLYIGFLKQTKLPSSTSKTIFKIPCSS